MGPFRVVGVLAWTHFPSGTHITRQGTPCELVGGLNPFEIETDTKGKTERLTVFGGNDQPTAFLAMALKHVWSPFESIGVVGTCRQSPHPAPVGIGDV